MTSKLLLTKYLYKTIESYSNSKIEYIGTCAFYHCKILKEVSLPAAKYIGSHVFRNAYSLIYVNLPSAILIGDQAFRNCQILTKLNLPSVEYLGASNFQGDNALTTVILGANKVCVLRSSANIPSGITFYVPDNLVNGYKAATNWSAVANQIKGISQLPA